jgi:hypothetical protein
MSFATSWLEKRALFPQFINDPPRHGTGIIIVVPAYNEPGITRLLDSLAACKAPACATEVIIIVNAPVNTVPEILDINELCQKDIERWRKSNSTFFRLYSFNTGASSIKGWGVGLARKTGMDEALRRFSSLNDPSGVIASLDADCTVGPGYFEALCNELYLDKSRKACSVYFEHPLAEGEFPEKTIGNIIKYELHLRYFIQGLKYCGFPYAFHTVGSSMAVKASAYMASGGMNRRQAGEDFYFIQKLMPLGGYFDLNSTTVYPSPRESSRVPFGTGVAMARMMTSPEDDLLTYNFQVFKELLYLFSRTGELYAAKDQEIDKFSASLPPGLSMFITNDDFKTAVMSIRQNTSGVSSFNKRFFSWFNMFMIVRFLNSVSPVLYKKKPVYQAALELLENKGLKRDFGSVREILLYFRAMERKLT